VKGAFAQAYINRDDYIALNDLFAALGLVDDAAVRRIFYLFSLNTADLQKALIFSRYRQHYTWGSIIPESVGGFTHKAIRHRVMNRAWTARPTPTLDQFSDDLTDLARQQQVGFLIGHQQEYDTIVNVLARGTKQNVLIIGEPGVGKETIVSHLAFNIVKDTVPGALFDKRLVSLSIGELVSGAGPEEISNRVSTVVNEIMAAKNVILYIPDVHNLFKTAGEGFMNVASMLLPAIASDSFQVIGSTYAREFKIEIEPHTDFLNAFEPVRIEEISEDDAIRLLTYTSIILEKQYKVIISFEAVKAAVSIAHKYFKQRPLPASAEDLLKEALADATHRNEKMLTDEIVVAVAERKVNIPIHKATKEEAEKLLNLEEIIHENLVDQVQAVTAVARSLRQYRSGLARSSGPIATFLFVGPTGVGKTELAKILAKTQFGSEQLMLRFDMSEYQDKQSIFRFIGTPDGKMSGTLTESVIQKPYSLILLDEFEKAHPDVLNLFLQVLDDGRITDNVGRVVDFQNTIVIATSNANSDFIKESIEAGRTIDAIKDEFKKKLATYFRPELLNRFSDIIIFKNLSVDDTLAIARLQVQKLVKTLNEDQGIAMDIDDAVVQYLARIGYDPVFGARPLRTVINDRIKSQLAEMILRNEVRKGSHLRLMLVGDEIKFSKIAEE
jgi:ATP-dependent Clp protease ATP-binding subunit ClpA